MFRYLGPDGTRLAELAERAGMTPQSIGWHVDELEREGYLERIADPTDRRAKLIRATDKGQALMATAGGVLADVEREWAEVVGEEAFAELQRTLRTIRELQSGGEPASA